MSHQKIKLDIKGMHCRSCEILLEENIGEISGIKKVRTNYKKGTAEIEFDGNFDQQTVERAIISSGYSLGKEDVKHFFSRNKADYVELAASATIVAVLYWLIRDFGILNLNPNVSAAPGLVGVLIVGLTAGISTCMALVGGLILGISSRHAELHPEATASQKFRPHIFFNIGRLASYAILGGLIGLIGSALKLSSSALGFITLGLGFVMLFLGLKLVDIFPRLHNKGITFPKSVGRLLGLGTAEKEYSHRGAFIAGALTFFVPCGFTQAMQLYAVSTGSFVQGALIMGVFALGTLPGIIGIGGLTSAIKGAFARYFFKAAGVVVVALALFNISSGYTLSGLDLGSVVRFNQAVDLSQAAEARIENGKQVVEMTQGTNGYSPRQFTVKKGIPVVWKIKSESQYTCAAYIYMPGAGISQPLRLGDNAIEFLPSQSGQMRFSCSMGMYTGSFNIID